MKITLLSFFILIVIPTAYAETYRVPIRQNAQLRDGDIAIVMGNEGTSVITCGDGSSPNQQDFVARDVIPLTYQQGNEFSLRYLCEGHADPAVTQTHERLERQAKNDCLRTFSSCTELGETEYRFLPKEGNYGAYRCAVKVTVRGRK